MDLSVTARDVVNVLLVEDDAGDALLVEELLSDGDAEVRLTTVRTVAEARHCLEGQHGQHCVLLDLDLPDATGLEALRVLDGPEGVAVVVLTGRSDAQLGVAAVAAGAQDYLLKGEVDGDLLARVIRYAVGRVRAEDMQRQLREERLLAMEKARLERGLLPSPLLDDPRLQADFRYQPGRQRALLGGDFYDVVQSADGTVHAMVGDVCGHGPDEAALGVYLRVAWRTMVLASRPVDEVFNTMQRILVHERHLDGLFATICTLSVAPDRETAELRMAGHPAPVLLTPDGATLLSAPIGIPLGVVESASWAARTVELGPQWSVLMFTDGLIEGRVGEGPERLGPERLAGLAGRFAAEGGDWRATLLDDLVRAVCELNRGDLVDDVAALMLTRVADDAGFADA
ncbi:PP2C family protein-serine/threonine phosphatase [Actinokineospora guangxiensis]|uniref:PP2C family protein-serine/threonine phosphatase n=1 Tax=Actinokineospora guangxiensis TaxID=1490288 RepID=A0ABW0ET94_9PSEU